MMTRPVLAIAAAVASAAIGPAQARPATLVVPSDYEGTDAPGTAFWAVSPFAARRQLLIGASHLAPALRQTLQGLDLRRNTGDNAPLRASQVQVELTLSHSPRQADAPSSMFAANRGGDATIVFQGVVSLPASPGSPTVPAPWIRPHAFGVIFQKPFRYDGGTLCVETLTTPINPGPGREPSWWPIDAVVERFPGSATLFGANCVEATPGVDAASLVLGSTAVFHLRGKLDDASTGLCFLGTNATRFGPLALPLNLASAGAPGCWLNVDLIFGAPTTAVVLPNSELGLANWRVVLPVDPSLAGQSLYNQWVWTEPGANPLGLTFSEGLAATLAGTSRLTDATWIEATDLASQTGDVLRGRLPVLRLRL